MRKVKAIFVSHEHSDHIRGIPVLARKYQLPVFITPATCQNSRLSLEQVRVETFEAYTPLRIGELKITGFPKLHDAADPHSFVVDCRETRIGIFTDIGSPCENVIHYFSQCHAAFLEANYDDDLLQQGYYPYYLKRRIQSDKGHLSNKQALDLFRMHKPAFMSHVLLSHLSKDNNCPKLAKELFTTQAFGTEVIVASRFEETPVYTISAAEVLI